MRVVASVAAVFAAVAAAGASAAPDAELLIRPAIGVGKLRLGMTEREVRRAMGAPRVVLRRAAGFGRQTVEYEYGFGDYGVRLFGPPSRLRVVQVTTVLRRERTARGIGPGALERRLLRAYPGLRCQRLPTIRAAGTTYVTADERSCTLFTPSGRRTTFVSGVPRNATFVLARDWVRQARVLEVRVSEPS